jgi:predicted metal-dependent phosphoesterase TrpH
MASAQPPAPPGPVSAPTFDLQCHSRHSDGALEPSAVVARAAATGVELLALTDHDTVEGVQEAIDSGEALGVRVVPAVELSAVHEASEDLHVLGYCLDHRDARLHERLEAFRADRAARAEAMAAALEVLGWVVDRTQLDASRRAGGSVGRPHLAAAVTGNPANAARLQTENLPDASALLEAYLTPGRPAYRPRSFPSVAEAIEVIHQAGGVAVWAHPFWDLSAVDEVLGTLTRFTEWGLDGVEAFYPTHRRDQVMALVGRAEELGLLMTGSSDFHAPAHRLFKDFRAFELYGCRPELGPILD